MLIDQIKLRINYSVLISYITYISFIFVHMALDELVPGRMGKYVKIYLLMHYIIIRNPETVL